MYGFLLAFNLAAWALTLVASARYPILLPAAFLAYSFGLRHAVDADHIAAIDNTTRKLMQDGQRPVAVGLGFSLGHSPISYSDGTTGFWVATAQLSVTVAQNGATQTYQGHVDLTREGDHWAVLTLAVDS